MSIQSGQAKLSKATKDLAIQWQRVAPNWRDPVGMRFEKEFLGSLEQKVKQASTGMSSLAETLHRLRRDCS